MFDCKFKLFRLFGFEVGLDPSWIVLAILVAWSLSTGYFPSKYQGLSTQEYWTMGVIGALGLFISIVAHEFSHSLIARRSGMPMKGITLFIFSGIAEMNEEPPNAWDEFWIAIVGPLSSFAFAAVFYGIGHVGESAGWSTAVYGVMGYLGMINVFLVIFNLVPAFPLDGGACIACGAMGLKGQFALGNTGGLRCRRGLRCAADRAWRDARAQRLFYRRHVVFPDRVVHP